MVTRAPLSLIIYSGGVWLSGKFSSRLCGRYFIWITISIRVQTDLSLSSRYLLEALRCTPTSAMRRKSWCRGLDRPWWCDPCPLPWIPGVITPTPRSTNFETCKQENQTARLHQKSRWARQHSAERRNQMRPWSPNSTSLILKLSMSIIVSIAHKNATC